MAKRKQCSPELKARVALAAIRGDGTVAELTQRSGIHATMIQKRKREALDDIGNWMTYYSQERPHSSLGDRTPEEAYLTLAA